MPLTPLDFRGMTPKELDCQRQRVIDCLKVLQPLFYLSEVRIEVHWFYADIPDFPQAAMCMRTEWDKARARLSVALESVAQLGDRALEDMVGHELAHVCTEPLLLLNGELAHAERAIVERTAELLSRAILGAWRAPYKEETNYGRRRMARGEAGGSARRRQPASPGADPGTAPSAG